MLMSATQCVMLAGVLPELIELEIPKETKNLPKRELPSEVVFVLICVCFRFFSFFED